MEDFEEKIEILEDEVNVLKEEVKKLQNAKETEPSSDQTIGPISFGNRNATHENMDW